LRRLAPGRGGIGRRDPELVEEVARLQDVEQVLVLDEVEDRKLR
jgi:hypothetical protein